MTTKEFLNITEQVNNNNFFKSRGYLISLDPMKIYLIEDIYPIEGEYFIGVKSVGVLCALKENNINIEKIKIHYKKVQRLRDNSKYQKNIEFWKYKEPTLKDIRKKKLNSIKRLSKKLGS